MSKSAFLWTLGFVYGAAIFFLLESYPASIILGLSGAVLSGVARRFGGRNSLVLGYLYSFVSLYIFAEYVYYFSSGRIFLGTYFLGAVFLVLAALFSANRMDRWAMVQPEGRMFRVLVVLLFFGAASLWYACGIREIVTHIILSDRLSGLLLFTAGTSIVFGILEEKTEWRPLSWVFYAQLPAMLLFFILAFLWGWPLAHQLFAWSIAFFVQYRVLWLLDQRNSRPLCLVYHVGTLSLLFIVSGALLPASPVVPLLWSCLFLGLKAGSLWPWKSFPLSYFWVTIPAVLFYLVFWAVSG